MKNYSCSPACAKSPRTPCQGKGGQEARLYPSDSVLPTEVASQGPVLASLEDSEKNHPFKFVGKFFLINMKVEIVLFHITYNFYAVAMFF